MSDEEPLLTCGSCGCEISVAEDRDNAGLCDDCEMDFEFGDDDADDFDGSESECEVCGEPSYGQALCDECWIEADEENDDDE